MQISCHCASHAACVHHQASEWSQENIFYLMINSSQEDVVLKKMIKWYNTFYQLLLNIWAQLLFNAL